MTDFDLIMAEIGVRGELTAVSAVLAGVDLASTASLTTGPITLAIGGFDEDPRSLWDIPEVASYVRLALVSAGVNSWRSALVQRFTPGSLILATKCGAFGGDCPFSVTVDQDAPATL